MTTHRPQPATLSLLRVAALAALAASTGACVANPTPHPQDEVTQFDNTADALDAVSDSILLVPPVRCDADADADGCDTDGLHEPSADAMEGEVVESDVVEDASDDDGGQADEAAPAGANHTPAGPDGLR